ncbi:MAG: hypothetical protein KGP28_12560, partial [Bdellovibrionales bacterium]|nr:hypothetical protein [Bdellovibrionales bacterium]
TCTVNVRLTIGSEGAKSASLQVPYSYAGIQRTPVNFALSANVIADSVVFNPVLPLPPTQLVWSYNGSTCNYAESLRAEFFKSITLSSSVSTKATITFSGTPSGIAFFGKKNPCTQSGTLTCWESEYFSGPYGGMGLGYEFGFDSATPLTVYFKNTSGLPRNPVNPYVATALISYRPADGPVGSNVPKKVRTVILATWCY